MEGIDLATIVSPETGGCCAIALGALLIYRVVQEVAAKFGYSLPGVEMLMKKLRKKD